ncbi:MAG: beta-glucanase, partial [Verrucomicrobiota bacterium]|nr:beta-glucanase [Verrucomicrobiota bacterium]
MHKINGELWFDTQGNHINAHAGGIIWHKNRYYWYGEHKGAEWEGRLSYDGVHCYSSKDLIEWKNEGLVLKVSNDPKSPISKGCRIERPKVLFCKKTGKFVMWWHSTDANHFIAKSGVALSDSPVGPFELVHALRPDAGVWPLNVTSNDKNSETIKSA